MKTFSLRRLPRTPSLRSHRTASMGAFLPSLTTDSNQPITEITESADDEMNAVDFDPHQFIRNLNPNYKLEIHPLRGFPFNASHSKQGLNQPHFVMTIHNFLSPEESTLYRQRCRRLSEGDLMKHGGRRHALYFDINDSGLQKRTYRYGQQDWPMNNGIHPLQRELLTKIKREFGILLNGVVFNVYTSRKSHIWWHTDLQPGIGDIVCTFSTGRTEWLQFRAMHKPVMRRSDKLNDEKGGDCSKHNALNHDQGVKEIDDRNAKSGNVEQSLENGKDSKENEIVLNVPCHHGTLLIMSPGVNQFYQHRVDVPTKEQLDVAMQQFQSIDRENTTLHFHFDETKRDSVLNLESDGGFHRILRYLSG